MKYIFLISILTVALPAFSQEEKDSFVYDVYNEVFSVIDNGRINKPKLILSNNSQEVATYYPAKNELHLGNKLIRLSRSFEDDSSNVIAHVLGHELAHLFFHHDDFSKNLGTSYASKEFNKKIVEEAALSSALEQQADEYAMFFAHAAGFKTSHLASLILDSIYDKFKLDDNDLSNYPSLQERKRIAILSARKMEVLNKVFDMSGIALVCGKYKLAQVGYEIIIDEKFYGPEIYNNKGLSYLLEANEYLDEEEYPYIFPYSIDFRTGLSEKSEPVRGNFEIIDDLLIKAKKNFEYALQQNPSYFKAQLNLAITYFLLEDSVNLQIAFLKLSKTTNPETQQNQIILKSIINHKNGKVEEALKELKQISFHSSIARLNYKKLYSGEVDLEKNGFQYNDTSDNLNKLLKLAVPEINFLSKSAKEADTLNNQIATSGRLKFRSVSVDEFATESWICKKDNETIRLELFEILGMETLTNYDLNFMIKNANVLMEGHIGRILRYKNIIIVINDKKQFQKMYLYR